MTKIHTANRSGVLSATLTLSVFALLITVGVQYSSELTGAVAKRAAVKATTTQRIAPPAPTNTQQFSAPSNGRAPTNQNAVPAAESSELESTRRPRMEFASGHAEVKTACECFCGFDGDILCPAHTSSDQHCSRSGVYRIPASPSDDCTSMNGVRCAGYIDNNWLTAGGVLEQCMKFVAPAVSL